MFFRIILGVFIFLSMAVSSSYANKIIYYAGFGNVYGDNNQPFFNKIFGIKANKNIQEDINAKLIDKIKKLKFKFPSSIIIDPIKIDENQIGKQNIFALVLISNFEIEPYTNIETQFGSLYLYNFITGITALLIEPQTGYIHLSSTSLGYKEFQKKNPITKAERNNFFTDTYIKTAINALDRLEKQSFHTDLFEWDMVTEVTIESKRVKKLFNINEDCNNKCLVLKKMLAQGISDSLQERGNNMLPSFLVRSWGETVLSQGKIIIQIKSEGRKREELLKVNVSPKSAYRKLTVSLTGFSEKNISKNKKISKWGFLSWIKVDWHSENFKGNIVSQGTYGEQYSKQPVILKALSTNQSVLNDDSRYFHYLAAIKNTIEEFKRQ